MFLFAHCTSVHCCRAAHADGDAAYCLLYDSIPSAVQRPKRQCVQPPCLHLTCVKVLPLSPGKQSSLTLTLEGSAVTRQSNPNFRFHNCTTPVLWTCESTWMDQFACNNYPDVFPCPSSQLSGSLAQIRPLEKPVNDLFSVTIDNCRSEMTAIRVRLQTTVNQFGNSSALSRYWHLMATLCRFVHSLNRR